MVIVEVVTAAVIVVGQGGGVTIVAIRFVVPIRLIIVPLVVVPLVVSTLGRVMVVSVLCMRAWW